MVAVEISRNPVDKKMMGIENTNKNKYLVVQELKLAKLLAGNDEKIRAKALKNLKYWFETRSKTMPFTNDDFQRIWKGLFYCMWMSDKPLVQEDCADKISKLVHALTLESSLLFFRAGLTILSNEWIGIDQLRIDKFLMLVRRLLREMLIVLKNNKLNTKNIQQFGDVLSNTLLHVKTSPPLGLFMHFVEIFMEELAKVTGGKIHSECVIEFLRPFIRNMASSADGRNIGHLRKFIFTYLIRQSRLGLEYQEKYEAWRQEGFPGSIDSMQKIKLAEDEKMSSHEKDNPKVQKEKILDPRAGRVDVEIPQIKFNAKHLAAALLEYRFDKSSTAKSRKLITTLADQFTKLGNGVYPLGIKKVESAKKGDSGMNIQRKEGKKNKEERLPLVESTPKTIVREQKNKSKINNSSPNDDRIGGNDIRKANDRIKKSNIRTLKRLRKEDLQDYNPECAFERNSGTWFVFDVESSNVLMHPVDGPIKTREITIRLPNTPEKGENITKNSSPKMPKKTPKHNSFVFEDFSKTETSNAFMHPIDGPIKTPRIINRLPLSPEKTTVVTSPKKKGENITKNGSPKKSKKSPELNFSVMEEDSSNSGLVPVKLFESPTKEKELFPKSEWDEPLLEGEYEICIPSKKYKTKMEKLGKKKNQTFHEMINNLQKIKGKSRLSLDPSLVKNPFLTPNSGKKVKINIKLNKSQEIHEHHAQILSSPAIPYDASKKPLKPLLKTGATSTPINPFYNKQLNI
ncbi:hypothetical protein JTB14_000006 [Gonioctena quinquepunctata]|nr:hypothetical protein JTB14_000006 [Gonioctena quinquepunctata]